MSPVDRAGPVNDRASGRRVVNSRNFTTAAKWYTFGMGNSADNPKCCHRGRQTTVQSCAVEIFSWPGQLGWSVHMSPVNRDPGRRDWDLGWPGWPVLIWTHRNFHKGNSGRARSRLTGLMWTGPKRRMIRPDGYGQAFLVRLIIRLCINTGKQSNYPWRRTICVVRLHRRTKQMVA